MWSHIFLLIKKKFSETSYSSLNLGYVTNTHTHTHTHTYEPRHKTHNTDTHSDTRMHTNMQLHTNPQKYSLSRILRLKIHISRMKKTQACLHTHTHTHKHTIDTEIRTKNINKLKILTTTVCKHTYSHSSSYTKRKKKPRHVCFFLFCTKLYIVHSTKCKKTVQHFFF